jgi:hypothetical protein
LIIEVSPSFLSFGRAQSAPVSLCRVSDAPYTVSRLEQAFSPKRRFGALHRQSIKKAQQKCWAREGEEDFEGYRGGYFGVLELKGSMEGLFSPLLEPL